MFTVREVSESGIPEALDLSDLAFHERSEEEARERFEWLLRRSHRIGAYDEGVLVGLAVAIPMEISVPGGSLPCAGVTWVAVMPTHRRTGVLTAMLGRLWTDTRAPLAALYVSEGLIYGRYGFGPANHALHLEVSSDRPIDLRIEPDPRRPRLVPTTEAPKVLAPIYQRACARRPGQFGRDEGWWEHVVLTKQDEEDEDLSEPRVVVIGDSGYAVYRTKRVDDDTEVHLVELEADDTATEAALWRYLCSIDLTGKVRSLARPVDDLLPTLVADVDRVTVTRRWAALWLRLVDLPAALAGRGWAEPVDLVLDVADDRIPANHGRWRLTVTEGGVTCRRSEEEADLALHVRDLASVYLGDAGVARLVRAGLATEYTPGAAVRLDAALRTELAPFSADEF
ncbi:GNAT family N-acetyltransferase [Rhizohabitans arisaemae]|uniref:GNAT family N-acetyltransferase n=1 Tax=Rhizohabitans arisaemae TaxID=2720610 RepID=UPI0024B21CC2|nr:GNAT family N-acetyltransferase [Rhizohabitans arisaemae]